MKLKGKSYQEESVLDASLARMRRAFQQFGKVWVSFSGGKDSTIVLQVALQVAQEQNKLPLDVFFVDEEAVDPDTIAYVERVAKIPGVRLHWICVPIRHRNAASRDHPWWWCWDPREKDKWCRPMPEGAITEVPGWEPQWETETSSKRKGNIPELSLALVTRNSPGIPGVCLGIRAQESLRRLQGVTNREVDNWIVYHKLMTGGAHPGSVANTPTPTVNSVAILKPIYDWTHADVWHAPHKLGWDYSRAYDKMRMIGVPTSQQRVAPPYGEEPLQGLDIWGQLWPELWDKMSERVPGANAGARYSRTKLYGYGSNFVEPPEGWKQFVEDTIRGHKGQVQKQAIKDVRQALAAHKAVTSDPIPADKPHEASGVCWRRIARVVFKGNMKGRKEVRAYTQIDNSKQEKRG